MPVAKHFLGRLENTQLLSNSSTHNNLSAYSVIDFQITFQADELLYGDEENWLDFKNHVQKFI